MGTVIVLVSVYLAFMAALGVWVVARVVRGDEEKLGDMRPHLLVQGAILTATAACALAAAFTAGRACTSSRWRCRSTSVRASTLGG